MWVLGVSAVVGNIFVFMSRCRAHVVGKAYVQSFLILNLALSDLQMGIYMLIMATVDVYYGDEYFKYSAEWQSSVLCRVAGCLSLLSSEASVWFLTLLSIDRFISICFPFKLELHLRKTSVRVVVSILWLIAFSVSFVAVLVAGPDSDLYGLSDVCIGLPLITRPSSYSILTSAVGNQLSDQSFNIPVAEDSKPAWYLSIAIFLGVNLVCFTMILICYVAIFLQVKKSAKSLKRNKERDDDVKMAIKMAVIVGTDFLCWMPIIIMGVLSQTQVVVIPLVAYVWSVVFILPINSSLNPYLYTISSLISARKTPGSKTSSSSSSNTVSRQVNTTQTVVKR